MGISLAVLVLALLVPPSVALNCHHCWYESDEVSKLHLYDKLKVTPTNCASPEYCEGVWCIQRLSGRNISFSCSTHSPLDYLFADMSIESQCQAFYSAAGVAHAACFCRGSDYCNRGVSVRHNFALLALVSLLRLFGSGHV